MRSPPNCMYAGGLGNLQGGYCISVHSRFQSSHTLGRHQAPSAPEPQDLLVALIPQERCHNRIILDLSFLVYQEVDGVITVTQKSVNDTIVLSAPSILVRDIGKVLLQLLQYMRDTPAGLHILFSKLDISDGFWHLVVHNEDCFNFAYVLPQEAGEPIRLVIPAVVQMGWVEIPGLFCTVTESTRDLTQHFVDHVIQLPHDPVEDLIPIADVPL
jgi:hypothetical protein